MRKVPGEIDTAGAAIRWARLDARLTIRALAARCGFTGAYVCDIEHNRRAATDALEKIAAALDVEPSEFTRRIGIVDRKMSEFMARHPDLIRTMRDRMRRCTCDRCLVIR